MIIKYYLVIMYNILFLWRVEASCVFTDARLGLLPQQSICVGKDTKMDFIIHFINNLWARTFFLVQRFFFTPMGTLFKRITHFVNVSNNNGKKVNFPVLSQEQRAELGKIVCAKFIEIKPPDEPINNVTFTTEEGTFKVLNYPRYFHPQMEILIRDYFASLPPQKVPKIRKRIPAAKPVFSSKMLSK